MLAGIAVCYAMPKGRRREARLTAAAVVSGAGLLLLSLGPYVFPSGQLEQNAGELVTGIHLTLRAESSGTAVLLLALLLTLVALLESGRRPKEQAALLLCVLGTVFAALGGNAVLLFGGLELANVGALLLHAAGSKSLDWRDRAGFTLQHIAALGLLVAALRLQNQYQTADLVLLPPGALGTAIALGWAGSGVARILAAPRLPGCGGNPRSSAWTFVAAAPVGLLVLLRLVQVAGTDFPPGVGPALVVTGLLITAAGAGEALRVAAVPAASGRALCLAMVGPVVFTAGIPGGRAIGAFAACGLALCLALAMAPAWGGGGETAAVGRGACWLRSLALALASGFPLGYGGVAMLLSVGATATLGPWAAITAMAFGLVVLLTACAGAVAARAALTITDPRSTSARVRPDAAAAVAIAVAGGIASGLVQRLFVGNVVAGAGTSANAVDTMAMRGPGGGWSGGYLIVAVAVCAAMVAAVCVLVDASVTSSDEHAGAPAPSRVINAWSRFAPRVEWWRSRIVDELRWFDRVDRWLEGQPSLASVVIGTFALMWVFR